MTPVLRAARIGRVLVRYRLDDLLDDTPAERWLRLMHPFVPRASREIAAQSRGARLRLALQELGPIFVKFGQALSVRPDLVGPEIADELAKLQDAVPPFPAEQAVAMLERAFGRPVGSLFAEFDRTAIVPDENVPKRDVGLYALYPNDDFGALAAWGASLKVGSDHARLAAGQAVAP